MFHDMFWGGMWFSWIFWVVFIVLIIWIVANSKSRNQHNSYPPSHETPLDIIKKRYAKGEITKEQFEQMKKDIE